MSFSRGTVVKSLFWKFFERLSVQLIQFIVTIVLARLILPSEYGIIAIITIFIQLCDVIIDGGLNTALIQKKDSDNKDFSTIFYFSIFSSLLMYGIMYLCSPIIAYFYNQDELTPVIRILCLSLPFYAINSIQRAFVSKKMLFQQLFYCNIIAVILSGSIGIGFAYNGSGVWALVAQSVSYQTLVTIIIGVAIRWRPIFYFSYSRFKILFSYGWKILGTNFITSLFVNIRKLVIGKYFTPASLAYYEKGDQLPSLAMSNILISIQTILLPVFSDSQDDRSRVKDMMRRSTKLTCFFIYPLMVGMIVTAKPLIIFLLTEKWLPVVPFVQILCVANFFRPITLSNWEAIKALGYSGITLKLEIIKKVVDVIILVISVYMGLYAIAWGCVLFNLICVYINLTPNKKLLNYGVREQIIDAVPTFIIAAAMGGVIYWIQFLSLPSLVILLFQILLGAATYFGLCHFFKEESYMYIVKMIKENKSKLYMKPE